MLNIFQDIILVLVVLLLTVPSGVWYLNYVWTNRIEKFYAEHPEQDIKD